MINSFARCKELGCLPTVHCENGELVIRGQRAMLAAGITGPEGHPYLPACNITSLIHFKCLLITRWSRPPEVEAEAANRASTIAKVTNVPVYLCHNSCKEALDVIRTAKESTSTQIVIMAEMPYFYVCFKL